MPQVTSIIQEDAGYIVDNLNPELAELSGATVLITGAGGFLGSTLLDVIAAYNRSGPSRHCRAIAVDNYSTGLPERIAHLEGDPDFDFLDQDVTQPLELEQQIDWVIHGASIASPIFYRRDPLAVIDVNVNGTWKVLEMARRGVRGMVFLSSSEIYGDPDAGSIPSPEDYLGYVSCTGPRACYDESKRLGETLCTTYHRIYGVPAKSVRPFNVYGPGQRLDDQRIIPDLMAAAVAGRPLVLYSDGRATRSFCYIRDFVRGLLHVLIKGAPGEAYNVGNDEELSIKEVTKKMAAIAASPPLAIEQQLSDDADYLTDNPQRRCPDLKKLRSATRWDTEVGIDEGLTRTLASYREEEAARSRP
jgi:dTDP-glucose 4,6-dehydratase/UDP-glucuronate decarboxylase